jgi:allantoin racemase
MQLAVINPNTTEETIEGLARTADEHTSDDVTVVARAADCGPETIESHYDDALSVPGLLDQILTDDESDAFVDACFDDPGIDACREVTDRPVVGVGEASMYYANMLGVKFSVVSVAPRGKHSVEKAVSRAGLEGKCASIRCTDLGVADVEDDREATVRALVEVGRRCVEEDEAEAICLGCSGMANLDTDVEAELGVPVVDPTAAAATLAEGLLRMGKTTSKVRTYATPESKERVGYPEQFQFRDTE